MSDKENQVVVQEQKKLTASERFTNKVLTEFASGVGTVVLTDFQKRLAQNYFISIDAVLKTAELNRMKKQEKYRDKVAVAWENINMESLSRNVVAFARIGLDPAQKNHINMIPYKNNSTGKYDIGFIEGYRGIELKSTKYGLKVPDAVVVELVYSNDKFKSIKKDCNNACEGYEFEIVNDFDRGTIIGGFYYHIYNNSPEKNKLVVLTMKDIEKRKPKYASAEFWGGDKDVWENGKKVGTEKTDGWYEKMCYKTIYRAAFGDITIDSQKLDDDYFRVKQMENEFNEANVEAVIEENANQEYIDIESVDAEHPNETEIIDVEPEDQKTVKNDKKNQSDGTQETIEDAPGY